MSTEFKVGDRVRVVGRNDGLNGMEGVVVELGAVYRRVTLDVRPGRYWRFCDFELERLS